jgi:hypothetical protein
MAKFGLVRAAGYHMGLTKGETTKVCFYGYNKEAFHASKTLMFCCNSQLSNFLSICMKKKTNNNNIGQFGSCNYHLSSHPKTCGSKYF